MRRSQLLKKKACREHLRAISAKALRWASKAGADEES